MPTFSGIRCVPTDISFGDEEAAGMLDERLDGKYSFFSPLHAIF